MTSGLFDTSIWVARELGRTLDEDSLPDRAHVCVITLAELGAGVLAAADTITRSRRLATLTALSELEPLPVDAAAARHWATLRVQVQEAGRRVNVNDLWIASIALAHDLAVVTQDADFGVLAEVGGVRVIQV